MTSELKRYTETTDSQMPAFMEEDPNGEYVLYSEAAAVVAQKDAEIECVTKSRDEAWQSEQKWKDKYNREVLGLNNEGDPIGGDPAHGLKQRAEAAEAELAQIKAQEPSGYVVEIYSKRNRDGIEYELYIARSRYQPLFEVAQDCVEHWRSTVYKNITDFHFRIVPLFAAPVDQTAEIERLREALEFYAGGINNRIAIAALKGEQQ